MAHVCPLDGKDDFMSDVYVNLTQLYSLNTCSSVYSVPQ
jgi:hypothetical protein